MMSIKCSRHPTEEAIFKSVSIPTIYYCMRCAYAIYEYGNGIKELKLIRIEEGDLICP